MFLTIEEKIKNDYHLKTEREIVILKARQKTLKVVIVEKKIFMRKQYLSFNISSFDMKDSRMHSLFA